MNGRVLSRMRPLKSETSMMRLALVVLAISMCWTSAFGGADASGAFDIKQKTELWERYTSPGEEFTVLLPKPPWVVPISRPPKLLTTPPDGLLYAAYDGGTGYVMLSFDNSERQEELDAFIEEFRQYGVFNGGATFERELVLHGYKGKQYRVRASTTDISGIVQFYRTKNRVYIFEAIGDARSLPAIERFLKSVTLDMKTKAKNIARLQGDREAAQKSEVAAPPPKSAESQTNAPQARPFSPREVTRKAVLVARAEPRYTEEARRQQVSGTVVLRAVFSSSGEVTGIRAVSGLPYGLTEKAIAAARRIAFIPAMKDGRFVSQYIQIEYNFNLY
jgi:TonB family protein